MFISEKSSSSNSHSSYFAFETFSKIDIVSNLGARKEIFIFFFSARPQVFFTFWLLIYDRSLLRAEPTDFLFIRKNYRYIHDRCVCNSCNINNKEKKRGSYSLLVYRDCSFLGAGGGADLRVLFCCQLMVLLLCNIF